MFACVLVGVWLGVCCMGVCRLLYMLVASSSPLLPPHIGWEGGRRRLAAQHRGVADVKHRQSAGNERAEHSF